MSSSCSSAPLATTSTVLCGRTRTCTLTWPRGLASTRTRAAVQVPSASTMWEACAAMASRVTEMMPPSTEATSIVRTWLPEKSARARSTRSPNRLTHRQTMTAMA